MFQLIYKILKKVEYVNLAKLSRNDNFVLSRLGAFTFIRKKRAS